MKHHWLVVRLAGPRGGQAAEDALRREQGFYFDSLCTACANATDLCVVNVSKTQREGGFVISQTFSRGCDGDHKHPPPLLFPFPEA